MPRPLNPQRDQILRMREDGLTFAAIAERMKMTRSAVSGVCRRAGLCGQIEKAEPPRQKQWHGKQCIACRRPIEKGKTFCGPCGWEGHMAARKRERAHV